MLELAGIIILGILAQWMAHQFKIPAILPLILIGLFVGPVATLISETGESWIQPMWDGERGLFPGQSLFHFVSLAISIILFEGGLTLKTKEIRNVGGVIYRLISIGSLVTFLGAGIAAHYIFGLNWEISFLFSGLIIVTGPTVIQPILRNIPLKQDVSAVLKWEGILIDPIGALVAVLVFEFISAGGGGEFTKTAAIEFGKIVLFGSTFGFAFAHALAVLIRKKVIPHYLLNVFTLATVLGVFVLSDQFAHESGLLSVVVMGMVMGNMNLPNLKELLYFKESLSVLLISILFILLSANMTIDQLYLIFNWNTAILFAVIVFVIRPIGVFLSSFKSDLKFNEKLFISWVGPRGIVAAGIASLFGLKLAKDGVPGAEYITPLVFMIVLGTVLLNATTARLFAKMVGVFLTKSEGTLIIGASKLSRAIGKYLVDKGRHVVMIDNNEMNITKARENGVQAINANIYSEDLINNIELSDVGYLIALTGNTDINKYAIDRFQKQFGENGSFRLKGSDETPSIDNKEVLFMETHDFTELNRVINKYPKIREIDLYDEKQKQTALRVIHEDDDVAPLFYIDETGEINIIQSDVSQVPYGEGCKLVYLGRELLELDAVAI